MIFLFFRMAEESLELVVNYYDNKFIRYVMRTIPAKSWAYKIVQNPTTAVTEFNKWLYCDIEYFKVSDLENGATLLEEEMDSFIDDLYDELMVYIGDREYGTYKDMVIHGLEEYIKSIIRQYYSNLMLYRNIIKEIRF